MTQGTIDYDHFDQTPKKIDGSRINEQEDNQLPKKNCMDELVMYNSERPKIYEISCNNSEDRSLDDYSFKDFMCGESNNLETDFGIEVEKVTEKNMMSTSSDDIFQSNTVNDIVIIDNEDELTVENWRNKAVPSKKKSLYLNDYPEIRIASKKYKRRKHIEIARNGNLLRPIKSGNQKVIMTNTCAFDNLLQIIAVGIMDSTTYEQISKSSTCSILKLACHLAMIGADKDF